MLAITKRSRVAFSRRHGPEANGKGDTTATHAPHSLARVAWFGILIGAVCLEGLARKLLPDVHSAFFYYSKDVALIGGVFAFGFAAEPFRYATRLLRGFKGVIALAFIWTLAEVLNPGQPSILLGGIGLRAYWLWWIAPLVVASALRDEREVKVAVWLLAAMAALVVAAAAVQFNASADSGLNEYARFNGESLLSTAIVGTTGRARVASTFAYLTGYTDFCTLIPPLLIGLALGLPSARKRRHFVAVGAGVVTLAAIPFSGSRAPILMAAIGIAAILWATGVVTTTTGRWTAAGLGTAVVLATVLAPDAVRGIEDRFGGEDTRSRLAEIGQWFPPIALEESDYVFLGDGTGTQQNARISFGVEKGRNVESETSRTLAEQGAIGYILVWAAKLGLSISLLRMYVHFKAAGRRSLAGTALAYAGFVNVGSVVFDHVFQSLLFTGVGLLLACMPRPPGRPPRL